MLDPISNEIDYVGPEIKDSRIKALYKKAYELKPAAGMVDLLKIAVHFQHNKRFLSWKNLGLQYKRYAIAYLDFTKLDYVVSDIKKADVPIIVRAHNVESDYARNDFNNKKSFVKAVTYALAKKHERYIVKHADRLLALTENDAGRFVQKYGISRDRVDVIPICMDAPGCSGMKVFSEPTRLLITGSLWYGVNLDGILWFLDAVCPKIRSPYILRIAGANPPKEFVDLCRERQIELVPSPPSMKEHLEWCDAVVCPIFSGAGMKVKIAEALAYGRPVITTGFGAIGYDIQNAVDSFVADSPEAFAACIDRYCGLSTQEKETMMRSARALFDSRYEIGIGREMLGRVLRNVLEQNAGSGLQGIQV